MGARVVEERRARGRLQCAGVGGKEYTWHLKAKQDGCQPGARRPARSPLDHIVSLSASVPPSVRSGGGGGWGALDGLQGPPRYDCCEFGSWDEKES